MLELLRCCNMPKMLILHNEGRIRCLGRDADLPFRPAGVPLVRLRSTFNETGWLEKVDGRAVTLHVPAIIMPAFAMKIWSWQPRLTARAVHDKALTAFAGDPFAADAFRAAIAATFHMNERGERAAYRAYALRQAEMLPDD